MNKILEAYRKEIELTENQILNEIDWKNSEMYCEWLAQTFYYASYSTRIIGLAGCHFDYTQNNLHLKFFDHAKEEKNHEKILITDLAHFKKTVTDFEPSPMAKMLYQNQYFWIQHKGPLSVYGYFLYLEGLAAEFGPRIYKLLDESYPKSAIKYMKVHVEEDQGHIEGHLKFLDAATNEQKENIIENMHLTGAAYRRFIDDIVSFAKQKNKKSNAA